MNKKNLCRKIALELGSTIKDTEKVVDLLFDNIAYALIDGETVTIRNFGKFEVKDWTDRMFRNPQTGERVPAKNNRKLIFKTSMVLKEALRSE